jgi:hypothetical protein
MSIRFMGPTYLYIFLEFAFAKMSL